MKVLVEWLERLGTLGKGESRVDDKFVEGVKVVVGEVQRRQCSEERPPDNEEILLNLLLGNSRQISFLQVG